MARDDARSILMGLGLPTAGLERAHGWNNEIWMAGDVVVRIAHDGGNPRLESEVRLLQSLPAEVLGPTLLASGSHQERTWALLGKAPGIQLSEAWRELSRAEREDATHQLAGALKALHGSGLELADPEWRLHQLSAAPVLAALERAAALDDADRELAAECRDFVEAVKGSLGGRRCPVHSDAHFDNVLWHEGRITCVLDFEYARMGPPDLELDGLHQFFTMPWLLVPEEREPGQRAALYDEAPAWLEAAYPDLYAHEQWRDRVRFFAISRELKGVLENGHWGRGDRRSNGRRLAALVRTGWYLGEAT